MKFLNLLIVLFLFYNFGGSRSSSCGELGNITYPYHLPGTCNWKAYELQCNGHDTVLSIGATTYLVKDMSIENMTLRLVDPDLAKGRCRLQKQDFFSYEYQNPSSKVSTWFSLGEYSAITFFNCMEELEDSMYKLIHCMDEPRSRIYAGFDNFAGSIPKSCAHVATTAADFDVETRWNDTDGVELMRILRQGFVVNWKREVSFFDGPEYNKKTCSLLKHCWASAKR
ncbi:serine/threonine-protein kinase [Carex littledalei]|uniref:Serine/threonine-protein kinase n=1 Tax=Carex littledalei TaxID=544730 RepID=A0A833R998_9POAL|nr:serine/threonine-protein kinase [Carex littledalei]